MMLVTIPESGPRGERKVKETRRRILLAALELFSERGVDAVTVEEIAERADYSRGTVFNHFSTKDSICEALGELQLETLQNAVAEGKISGPTAGEKIEQSLRVMAEFSGQDPERCRAILTRVLAALKPGELPEHRRRVFEHLTALAEEGQQSGEFRNDVPPCQLACFVMGMQLQATLLWSYGLAEGSLPEAISRVLGLGLEGIHARK